VRPGSGGRFPTFLLRVGLLLRRGPTAAAQLLPFHLAQAYLPNSLRSGWPRFARYLSRCPSRGYVDVIRGTVVSGAFPPGKDFSLTGAG